MKTLSRSLLGASVILGAWLAAAHASAEESQPIERAMDRGEKKGQVLFYVLLAGGIGYWVFRKKSGKPDKK